LPTIRSARLLRPPDYVFETAQALEAEVPFVFGE
jgi:hypothetical protein